MSHIDTVQQWLAQNNYDIAYISNYKTIAYFTGFESDPIEQTLALFIFPDHDPFIFAPAWFSFSISSGVLKSFSC